MKVCVVFRVTNSGNQVLAGIFETEEKADAYIADERGNAPSKTPFILNKWSGK